MPIPVLSPVRGVDAGDTGRFHWATLGSYRGNERNQHLQSQKGSEKMGSHRSVPQKQDLRLGQERRPNISHPPGETVLPRPQPQRPHAPLSKPGSLLPTPLKTRHLTL